MKNLTSCELEALKVLLYNHLDLHDDDEIIRDILIKISENED